MPLLSARIPTLPALADAEEHWRRPDPRYFAADLAALGAVFCTWREPVGRRSSGAVMLAPSGPDVGVLARPGLIAHAGAVTRDGPRESITVHDAAGVARCRLHLLPDTDYLAWDALLAHASPVEAPEVRSMLRARRGRRLRLGAMPIGPCSLVWTRPAPTDCPLSWRTVAELVRREGVSLLA